MKQIKSRFMKALKHMISQNSIVYRAIKMCYNRLMDGNGSEFMNDVADFAMSKQATSFHFSKEENAYVLDGMSNAFKCPACDSIVVNNHCHCGTLWNIYNIYEGSSIKTIARKIDSKMIPMRIASEHANDPVFELI